MNRRTVPALVSVLTAVVLIFQACGEPPEKDVPLSRNPSPDECREAIGVHLPTELLDTLGFVPAYAGEGPWINPGPWVRDSDDLPWDDSEFALGTHLRDQLSRESPYPSRVTSLVDSLLATPGSDIQRGLAIMLNGLPGADGVGGLGDYYGVAGADFDLAVLLLMHSGIPFDRRLVAWRALSIGLQLGSYSDTALTVNAMMSLACDAAFVVRPFTGQYSQKLSDSFWDIISYRHPTDPVTQALASAVEVHEYAFRVTAQEFPRHVKPYLARYADWEPDTLLTQGVRELIGKLESPAQQVATDTLQRALFALQVALASYWSDSDTFPQDIETLRSKYWPEYQTWPGIEIEVRYAGPMGWSATSRDTKTGRLCAFFIGDAPSIAPARGQGEIACTE